ncbi:hypothetical protein H8788_20835 [Parabacteroides faecis]|uniref:hypothetical protein n=1 Tax=Parabacteroides TaxID=375288 RepID=UPI000F00BDD3|nr:MULTISPECIES: hypothetical protein [Parabacteroides]MBC8620188.1 hypothetical protein [Parabacteroides faecis]RHS00955.1 hypothetical protein DWW23_00305 [Parabacteroides sp. AF14-59]
MLKKSIDEHENEIPDIFLLAFLLGDPKIREKRTWDDLARSFFKQYREVIYSYCHYDTGPLDLERIRVKEPKLFIEYLSGMVRSGMFGDCSYEELADYIYMIFQTDFEKSYICSILKNAHEDYLHIHDQIRREMKLEPKRKNGIFNN